MFWIIPAWVLSLIVTFLLGRYLGNLTKRMVQLEEVIKSKVDKKPEPEEPKSTVIDPLDPIQEAIYEHNKMMERLNPDE